MTVEQRDVFIPIVLTSVIRKWICQIVNMMTHERGMLANDKQENPLNYDALQLIIDFYDSLMDVIKDCWHKEVRIYDHLSISQIMLYDDT